MNNTHSTTFPAPVAPPFVAPPLVPMSAPILTDIKVLPPDASAPEVAVSESLLQSKAILVHLTLSKIGLSRQVRESEIELAKTGDDEELQRADTDRKSVRVVKKLFQCDELQKVERLDAEVRTYIKRKCLPSPLRGKSVYLLPLGNLEAVSQRLKEFQIERTLLVEDFVSVYPRLLVKARRQLRDLFDLRDYPDRAQVADCFNLHWQLIAIGVPDALAEISQDIWEQERQKSADQWAQAQEEIQMLLRVRLKGMVEHLLDRLQPSSGSKKKILRTSAVTNMTEFIQDFQALNITNDEQLSQVVGQVRDLMSGVDAQTLRDSKESRAIVMEGTSAILSELTTLIVDKPKRLITFDD